MQLDGGWKPYSPAESATIAAAHARGDASVTWAGFKGTKYTLDFAAKVQYPVGATNRQRAVRHFAGGVGSAAQSPKSAAVAAAATPAQRAAAVAAIKLVDVDVEGIWGPGISAAVRVKWIGTGVLSGSASTDLDVLNTACAS